MNPTVSIIVPIYNAEKYLNRCIDSILNQEYTDFELILANDGSKDSSGQICDEYAAKDKRVRVIHKENSGVSDTRNQAIDLATGTYLQFLDSDDWITPDATKLLVRAAEEHGCDFVIADFYRVVGERLSHKGDIEEDGVMTQEEFAAHMMENPADFYYGVLWNKLYRRDIVEEHHLRMDTEISWCEDFMFNLEYIRYAKVFYALQVPIYYYVKTKGSLASQGMSISNTVKMKLMVFEYYNNFYKHVFDESDYEANRLHVYRYFIDSASDGLVLPSILPGTQKLGDERISVHADSICNQGLLMDVYRSRKLLEKQLESVALKNQLTLNETLILFYLMQSPENDRRVSPPITCQPKAITQKELAEYTGISRNALLLSLGKLTAKELIKITDVKTEKKSSDSKKTTSDSTKTVAETGNTLSDAGKVLAGKLSSAATPLSERLQEYTLLPSCDLVLHDLQTAQSDYEHACFDGFTEEERVSYQQLNSRVQDNLSQKLSCQP